MCKKLLALLLCLCMLPVSALCEGFGTAFQLAFEMNADAYPEDVQDVLRGIADLVNTVTVEGTLESENGYFETDLDLLVGGNERTRTPVRIYGNEANWIFRSTLLGDETVYLFMDAMLEFAMKAHSHLSIPLQRAVILLTPYVHTHGVGEITAAMAPVLFAQEGSRQIPRAALEEMAQAVALAAEGRPFRYWAAAMGRETGYEYEMRDMMTTFPEWLDSFLAHDGITVDVTDTTETWSTGDVVLFERTFSLDDAQSVKLTLPASANGYTITAEAAFQQGDGLFHGSIDLLIMDEWETVVLDLHAHGTLPTAWPVTRTFSLTWDADGMAVGGDGVHLYFEGEGKSDSITLRQMTPDMEQTMFTLRLTGLKDVSPSVEPYTDKGISFVSVTSDTLAELMRSVAMPMIKGLLPVLAEVPATACQSVLDLLENSGVFGLLTDGLLGGDEWAEDEWSEDEWYEDEDWEDWSEDEEIW